VPQAAPSGVDLRLQRLVLSHALRFARAPQLELHRDCLVLPQEAALRSMLGGLSE
jgi:hypothetical protein